MKRRILINSIAILALFLWTAASAVALPNPVPNVSDDYVLSGSMDFWTLSDFTSNQDGTALFQIEVEEAAYESAFGLYTVNDIYNPTEILAEFEVFPESDEPLEKKTISFWDDGGDWYITDQYDSDDPDGDYWQSFGSTFGFYYRVDAGNNGSTDYTFYTANSLNTTDQGIEHIYTAYDPDTQSTYIYLEDLLAENADWDWEDMTVYASDVSPQPVPEPATMLLFGAGLSGFAFFARKRIAAGR